MTAFEQALSEALQVFGSLEQLEAGLNTAAGLCMAALQGGYKILICGNGGSASDAQHLAGELMGRYKENRHPLAAVALTADSSVLTCVGNDYRYEDVFARQVRGLGRAGDVLIAFTTSGDSPNVLHALAAATECGLKTVAFLGRDGGRARELADCMLVVRHPDTARAQEAHQFLMHCLMDAIEAGLKRG
jgi:D-sedoheptulose 7-phosphate isomerase